MIVTLIIGVFVIVWVVKCCTEANDGKNPIFYDEE